MRERRKVPRYQLGKLGMLYPPGGGVGTKAVVYSISSQGCSVECEKSPEVGKKCELYLDTDSGQIGVEAQAVSIDSAGRTGLRFTAVDKETRKRLGELCATLQVQALSAPVLGEFEDEQPSLVTAAGQEPARAAPWTVPSPSAPPASQRERRRVPRYVSGMKVSLATSPEGAAVGVSLITLSVLGGCLEGSDLPDPGQECQVRAEWEGRALVLPGKVVWNVRGRRVGVAFHALDEATDKLLRQACASLRLQPMAPLPPEPA